MALRRLGPVLLLLWFAACGGMHGAMSSDGGPGGGDAPASGSDGPVGPTCGNGVLEMGEQCDDGNTNDSDGCSSTCHVEPGWICPTANAPCEKQIYCGDGLVEPPEQCDDGNSVPGDGCSGTCQIEPNYTCPTAGQACVSTIVCGDGIVEPSFGEQCEGTGGGCVNCQYTIGRTAPGAPIPPHTAK